LGSIEFLTENGYSMVKLMPKGFKMKKTVHICSKCGTVSISGNQKCPSCGSDEESGWSRIDVADSRQDEVHARLKNFRAGISQTLRSYWKPAAAVLAIAALLAYMLPLGIAAFAIILIIAAGVGYRLIAGSRSLKNKRLYKKLLNMAGGDKALASRLIEKEHQRNPDGDIDEWLEDAIIRWERDLK
jgi:uncharacterized Zn finger protein (UPF0148 family)